MDSAQCDKAIEQNFIFADKIYNTGLLIEKYEEASQISDLMTIEKKRYVLLKNELWLNSILLKKKCNNPFHTLVYVYAQTKTSSKDAEQAAISDVLKQIKQEKCNKIILIPLAGDMGLDSVTMQLNIYNITYLPSIIINEKYVLQGYNKKEQIESYLNKPI